MLTFFRAIAALFLIYAFILPANAEADFTSACPPLKAATKLLKDRVPVSELKNRDQSALRMFEKTTQIQCSDEQCRICKIQAHEQSAKLYEKYTRDKEAFESYLKVAEGYLKEAPVLLRLSSHINRRLSAYYAEGIVTEQNFNKAYYWLILGTGKNVTMIGTMPDRKTSIEDFKKNVLANLSEAEIKTIDEQNRKHLEKLAQQQRNNFANMMDIMKLGFNPSAPSEEKANARLSFELGINSFHYDLEGVKKLIDMGALKNKPHPNSSFLFSAQEENDLKLLDLLIENNIDLNGTDARGFTVLHRAIGHGHTDFAIKLIEAGADLSIVSNSLKSTPLMSAAGGSNFNVVQALVDAGADVNQIVPDNKYYKNALEKALHFKYYEIAHYLKNQGAQIVSKSRHYPDPFPNVASKCNIDIKNCSDHSIVKRDRKTCEFPACPEPKQYTPTDKIAGTLSEIDMELSNKAAFILNNGSKKEKDIAIAEIKANPSHYNPYAMKTLSRVLFSRIEDEEAMFWYLAADLRKSLDVTICDADGTAKKKLRSYYNIVHQFKPYIELNPNIAMRILESVKEWDKKTPYNYDVRWVTVGGNKRDNKLTDPLPDRLCAPESKWEQARELGRKEYNSTFNRKIKGFDYRKPPETVRITVVPETEFEALLQNAQAGDMAAQFELTTKQYGRNATVKAAGGQFAFKNKWLLKAAQQGHAQAKARLGSNYIRGLGVSKDEHPQKIKEGKQLLLEAIQLDQPNAAEALSNYYFNNEKNNIEGYAWLSLYEYKMMQLIPQLQSFPAKRRLEKFNATWPEGELQKAKDTAKAYIEKYSSQ